MKCIHALKQRQVTDSLLETEEHNQMRKTLWMQVAIATAGSANCVNTTTAARYADQVLSDFDTRFKNTLN
jgi:hypothetical protein